MNNKRSEDLFNIQWKLWDVSEARLLEGAHVKPKRQLYLKLRWIQIQKVVKSALTNLSRSKFTSPKIHKSMLKTGQD